MVCLVLGVVVDEALEHYYLLTYLKAPSDSNNLTNQTWFAPELTFINPRLNPTVSGGLVGLIFAYSGVAPLA